METGALIIQKINRVIDEKGIKKNKVAASIGVPATTLNSWLNRSKDFPVSYVSAIADALGVSVNWLLTEGDAKEPNCLNSGLSDEETFLLTAYRSLDQEGKIVVANKAIEELRRKNPKD